MERKKEIDQLKEDDLLDYPHKLFLRHCYKDLTKFLFPNDLTRSKLSVVTGVPGIGKSTLQFYLFYHFMKSNFKEKSFIVSYSVNKYLYFKYLSDFKYQMTCYDSIKDIPNSSYKYSKQNQFCILDFESKDQIEYNFEYLWGKY